MTGILCGGRHVWGWWSEGVEGNVLIGVRAGGSSVTVQWQELGRTLSSSTYYQVFYVGRSLNATWTLGVRVWFRADPVIVAREQQCSQIYVV